MFKDIISMPETRYLGFGLMMPWENNLEMQFNLWKEAFSSGKIDKLKKICGCEQVIGIFCYNCDMETQTFSYHIACENTDFFVSCANCNAHSIGVRVGRHKAIGSAFVHFCDAH